jgi:D-alanyl-D-alanine carboxypeptidase
MKKFISFLMAIIIATTFNACKKSETAGVETVVPPITQADIAAVNTSVTNFMSTYNIPGASLAVSKNGKLVYMKGFGKANTTTGELVTPASRFRLASVSKTYTGVAIMKLMQNGLINIDAKVFGTGGILGNDYGTAPYNANLLNITVRHLLQHTAGAWGAATGTDVIDQNPTYTYKQLFDWIINTRPNPQAPGTVFDYTNVGYNLLGRIIEKVSGKTYSNYIKEDILAPIGVTLTDIAGKTEAEKKSNEVTYYGQGADAAYVYSIAFPRRDADGGLITTAKDLLKLVTATDGFATRPDILNSATITTYTTPSAVFSSYACGIGLWAAQNIWYDYGSLPGTRTGFFRDNNGICVALLLNSRVDPTIAGGDGPFVQAMQAVLLDLCKNSSYAWQDLDQF